MSLAEYDAYVAQLAAAGVATWAAERQAREKYPDAVRERELEAERREDVLEKEEQAEIRKLFLSFGFKVRNLSQARASKQSPGLADLYVVHRELPIAFWWEAKRQVGGKLSPAQVEFRDDCLRCGVGYGSGDRHAARTHLIKLGLAQIIGDTIEPIRRVG